MNEVDLIWLRKINVWVYIDYIFKRDFNLIVDYEIGNIDNKCDYEIVCVK